MHSRVTEPVPRHEEQVSKKSRTWPMPKHSGQTVIIPLTKARPLPLHLGHSLKCLIFFSPLQLGHGFCEVFNKSIAHLEEKVKEQKRKVLNIVLA